MVKVRKSDYEAQDLYEGFYHRGSSQMNQLKLMLNAVGNVREQILKTDENNRPCQSNMVFALLNTNFGAQFPPSPSPGKSCWQDIAAKRGEIPRHRTGRAKRFSLMRR